MIENSKISKLSKIGNGTIDCSLIFCSRKFGLEVLYVDSQRGGGDVYGNPSNSQELGSQGYLKARLGISY